LKVVEEIASSREWDLAKNVEVDCPYCIFHLISNVFLFNIILNSLVLFLLQVVVGFASVFSHPRQCYDIYWLAYSFGDLLPG